MLAKGLSALASLTLARRLTVLTGIPCRRLSPATTKAAALRTDTLTTRFATRLMARIFARVTYPRSISLSTEMASLSPFTSIVLLQSQLWLTVKTPDTGHGKLTAPQYHPVSPARDNVA
ncbi:hypothetical protein predicted by Glimmer/Critica [Salmonella enterica subsp. enterica serovar Weltevreden str. 2007-60-3289-1]|nr:hypothetical protein predicted by Glimmer/Critica [Salmonella enterica subsp. enterica serovar Weltevreden str. 2007-60-3289-1]